MSAATATAPAAPATKANEGNEGNGGDRAIGVRVGIDCTSKMGNGVEGIK